MVRIFRYEVNYYNKFKDEEKVDKGIVAAKDFTEAVSKLCDAEHGYGEDCLNYVKVIDCCDAIITDDDLMIDLRK